MIQIMMSVVAVVALIAIVADLIAAIATAMDAIAVAVTAAAAILIADFWRDLKKNSTHTHKHKIIHTFKFYSTSIYENRILLFFYIIVKLSIQKNK